MTVIYNNGYGTLHDTFCNVIAINAFNTLAQLDIRALLLVHHGLYGLCIQYGLLHMCNILCKITFYIYR